MGGELLLIVAAVTSLGAVGLSLGTPTRRPRWSRLGVWALGGTLVAAAGAMVLC